MKFREGTSYHQSVAPMKTFIQERLASLILAQGSFSVAAPDLSQSFPIDPVFKENGKTRRLLQTCDLLKAKYIETNDADYMDMYRKIRATIEVY